MKDLGSAEFAIREKAQSELLGWSLKNPEASVPVIIGLHRENDDPEIRKRAREILKALAEADYLSDGQGYLGILMQEEPLPAAQDGKAGFGIRVLDVMQGSPAEQAGLKVGDVVVSLDGKAWAEFGAVTAFSEAVAAMKPMTEVSLMVNRGAGEPVRITVKLGKRPIPDLRAAGDLGQLDQQAKERHFKQWLEKNGG